jgi:hypothetical protein
MMRIYLDGVRRVLRAPSVWVGAWAACVLLAVPLALVLRGMIIDHLDASVVAESTDLGVNHDWLEEFRQQASGIGATLDLSVLGFASVLRHASDLMDRAAMAPVLKGALGAWLVVWSFLSGGILDRYARNRPTWASGFFAACGTHFFRFLRLGVFAGAAYYVLFSWVHPWLFDTVAARLTRDLAVERTDALITLAFYLIFGGLLLAISLVFEYARVRIVVEDRRSAIGALLGSLRFVRRHPGPVWGLGLLNLAVLLVLAAVYAAIAPGAWSGGWAWLALAIGQLWIVVRLGVRLTAYAAAVSLFQRELAHAEYVATAMPEWPESPAAEALRGEPPTAAVP